MKSVLTGEQINEIQHILDASIPKDSDICVTRETVYHSLIKRYPLNVDVAHFEQSLTLDIKSGRIKGYETKRGRTGGICRKNIKNTSCSCACELTVNNNTYKLPMSEKDAEQFIVGILEAAPSRKGQIFINNKAYVLPRTILISNCIKPESEKLLSNCLKALRAQKID